MFLLSIIIIAISLILSIIFDSNTEVELNCGIYHVDDDYHTSTADIYLIPTIVLNFKVRSHTINFLRFYIEFAY